MVGANFMFVWIMEAYSKHIEDTRITTLIHGDRASVAMNFVVVILIVIAYIYSLRDIHFKKYTYNTKIVYSSLYAFTGIHTIISLFAMIAFDYGIRSGGETILPTLSQSYYFSIVTFTTLGYGDFSPHKDLILVFALEGLIGYMFFALIMGMITALLLQKSVLVKPEPAIGSLTKEEKKELFKKLREKETKKSNMSD